MTLRLVAWNLRAGGGDRVPRIVDTLRVLAPDVVVLTEFRHGGRGDELRAGLTASGLESGEAATVAPRTNTVLVAARRPIRALEHVAVPPGLARHVVAVEVAGLALLAVYFPQGKAKLPVFDWLLSLPRPVVNRPSAILGDLNTGRNDLDREPGGTPFVAADALDHLESAGWTDVWRHLHGTVREYSWRSPKAGFRIDHAIASPPLVSRLQSARYDHSVREAGATSGDGMFPIQVNSLSFIEGAGVAPGRAAGPITAEAVVRLLCHPGTSAAGVVDRDEEIDCGDSDVWNAPAELRILGEPACPLRPSELPTGAQRPRTRRTPLRERRCDPPLRSTAGRDVARTRPRAS